ncbi:MAG: helix-turn-helix domain-containing protein [Mycobacteriales bacterium]
MADLPAARVGGVPDAESGVGGSGEVWDDVELPRRVSLLRRLLAASGRPSELEGYLAVLSAAQRGDLQATFTWGRMHERARQEELAHRRKAAQEQVCAHVAAGRTLTDAARLAGVTAKSVHRWRGANVEFAAQLRVAREQGRRVREHRRLERRARVVQAREQHWSLKMTEGVQAAVVAMLGSGMNRGQAAAAVGVSRQTLYTWLRRAPQFRQAVLAAEAGRGRD